MAHDIEYTSNINKLLKEHPIPHTVVHRLTLHDDAVSVADVNQCHTQGQSECA
jgi:hypothetical protein